METEKETKIYLVRHGQTFAKTDENDVGAPFVCGSGSEVSRNTHLTENGKKQMFEIGKNEFSDIKVDLVVISDLVRSKESADELINGSGEQNKNVPVMIDPNVTEINYGEDDGVSEEKVKEKKAKFFEVHPDKNGDFNFAFTGAESFQNAGIRMANALKEISKNNPGKTILVVSHSGSMRALHLTGQIEDPNSQVAIGKDLKFGEVMKLKSDGDKLVTNI